MSLTTKFWFTILQSRHVQRMPFDAVRICNVGLQFCTRMIIDI